jgi:large subunit ribosomal protein L32e
MADKKTPADSKKSVKDAPKAEPAAGSAAGGSGSSPKDDAAPAYQAKAKPTLTDDQRSALGARRLKDEARPRFRRHEWWRYKDLGGKNAPWRVPRGIHSKVRRHFRYRPPLVSIGYRGPEAVRGLHPSGFEEVLVHNVEQLAKVDKATQAARVGGTVGARKAKLIEAEADKRGIRILNRRAA